MPHVRAQIRAAVVAVLKDLPTTADRVYPGRTRPLGASYPPTLLVYCSEESSEADAMGGILARPLTVVVEGRVIMADVPDDTLDQIALEVEPAMVADPSLGGLAREVTLIGTTIDTQSPGESHAGEVQLKYRVLYRTHENAPATPV